NTMTSQTWSSVHASPKYNDRIDIDLNWDHNYNEEKNDDFDHYLLEYPQKGSEQDDRRNRNNATKSTKQEFSIEGLLGCRLGKERYHSIYAGMKYQYNSAENNRSLYLLNRLTDFDGELGTLPSMERMEEAMDRDTTDCITSATKQTPL
ncbi:MAG: hypothetical protein ACI3ZD_01225, partial [Prevotella sp.]